MEKNFTSITASIMLEYLYCPRFIYFMKVLNINQNEQKRFKVQKGRDVHKIKSLTNIDYNRKKIDVVKKNIEEELYSDNLKIHGIIDEILFLNDGSASPLDYKYAEYKGRIYKTYKMQSVFYGLLIKENYNMDVNKGYIVYTRSKNHIEEIDFTEKDYIKLLKIIDDIYKIIEYNYYPKRTSVLSRCGDCCYRNICVK
ncbi:MAG: CRISPR-associated protein Cas4 [Spirochaetes bacterium]|nr:CRISPR-associated protein Cas4 [Spirochaetota bacterium]